MDVALEPEPALSFFKAKTVVEEFVLVKALVTIMVTATTAKKDQFVLEFIIVIRNYGFGIFYNLWYTY